METVKIVEIGDIVETAETVVLVIVQVLVELSRQNDPGLFTLKISYMLFFVDNNNNIYYSHKTVNREEEITAQVD